MTLNAAGQGIFPARASVTNHYTMDAVTYERTLPTVEQLLLGHFWARLFAQGVCIIAALLGMLKAGKIHVATALAFPHTWAAYLLDDSQAKLLLTNTRPPLPAR
jgi:acyl-CoA synthetase (AMP-forming)/AMP-acid ligase II